MTLIAEQLGSEVADVRDFDVLRLELRLGQSLQHRVAHHVGDLHAVARPVVGEVGLIAAEQVHPCRHVRFSRERAEASARSYIFLFEPLHDGRDRLDRANHLQPLTAGPQIAPALIGIAAARVVVARSGTSSVRGSMPQARRLGASHDAAVP